MNIERLDSGKRMSQAVIHGDTVYLAGQVGSEGDSASEQMRQALAKVDELLERCGSSRQHLLQVTIWVASMSAHFDEVNAVWDDWVPVDAAPVRAAGEAKLAAPELKVEVIVVAARA